MMLLKVVRICYGKANIKVMAKPENAAADAAEMLGIQALTFIAMEPERLGRFLAISGIGPDSLRAAAKDPGFIRGVLDYIMGNEKELMEFTEFLSVEPSAVGQARAALGGTPPGRDEP